MLATDDIERNERPTVVFATVHNMRAREGGTVGFPVHSICESADKTYRRLSALIGSKSRSAICYSGLHVIL